MVNTYLKQEKKKLGVNIKANKSNKSKHDGEDTDDHHDCHIGLRLRHIMYVFVLYCLYFILERLGILAGAPPLHNY